MNIKFKNAYAIICIFLCLAGFIPCGSYASSETIKWYPYEEGVAKGKKEGKKILINFYANWCGYCKVMDKNTFVDPALTDYLDKNYVSIKVDIDANQKVAREYKVRGLPTTCFISEQGGVIASLPGPVPAPDLLMLLKYVHTDSYQKMSFQEFQQKMK